MNTSNVNKRDIAIVGLSGRFSKSSDISSFWNNLSNDVELVHFYDENEKENSSENGKYINASARIDSAENFDYSFFGYTQNEAEMMDPQIRVLHEEVWLALENSGYDFKNNKGRVGCFLTGSDNLNWRAHTMINSSENVSSFLQEQISDISAVSTLISYALDLHGPSYFLNTACSSSLVAVHLACRNLLLRECGVAVAGGISISSDTETGYQYQEGMIMSADGHCKPFDSEASGTVNGEGAGVVVLKRLEDALNDKDNIYAVIKGSSTNNDGKRKVGYTAPSIRGQIECIKIAHKMAGIKPDTIGFVEAHGTATKLGDPVEVEALNKVFGKQSPKSCAIGSVKSNMGHLDGAAGIAGLIKAVLALRNKKIPGSLHFNSANPEIDFENGPFYVNKETIDWPSNELHPRRAAVSSFGIGGTNAHLVLEESFEPQLKESQRSLDFIAVSAKSKESLSKIEAKYLGFLKNSTNSANFAYTANAYRNSFKFRSLIINNERWGDYQDSSQLGKRGNIIFMFPGQGSQYSKMTTQLYHSEISFRKQLDECLELANELTNENYRAILGLSETSSELQDLNNTKYTQLSIFLVEIALAKTLMSWGVKPNQMIGHSLGEYVAATIAGVWTLKEGIQLVQKRADLMSSMPKGSMIAINAPLDSVQRFMVDELSVAAINTPTSCVLSGNDQAVDTLFEQLSSTEIPCKILNTSHAFHSQMMDEMLDEFQVELEKVDFKAPAIPFVSNLSGDIIKNEEATSSEYWKKHLRNTVKFSDGVKGILKDQYALFIEVGPGKTLSSMVKQHKEYVSPNTCVPLLSNISDESEKLTFTKAIGSIWKNGFEIDWQSYYKEEDLRKLDIPGYAFVPNALSARVNPFQQLMSISPATFQSREMVQDWLYVQGWKERFYNEAIKEEVDQTVFFLNQSKISQSLFEKYKEDMNCTFVYSGGELVQEGENVFKIPSSAESCDKLLDSIIGAKTKSIRIIHARNSGEFDSDEAELNSGYFLIQNLIKSIDKYADLDLEIIGLTSQVFTVFGDEKITPTRAALIASLQVAEKEVANLSCRIVEFDSNAAMSPMLEKIILNKTTEKVIAIRGRKMWVPDYQNLVNNTTETKGITQGGVYLITGATGGMGYELATYLKEKYDAKLILTGRKDPNEKLTKFINQFPEEVHYRPLDFDKELPKSELEEAIALLGGKVDGIFHCAGMADYAGLIIDRKPEDCKNILSPKLNGSKELIDFLTPLNPDFILLCSSTSSVLAPFGQLAYTAANLIQNQMAVNPENECRIITIAWDTWKESGMAVKSMNRFEGQSIIEKLDHGLTNAEGMEIFEKVIESNASCVFVSIQGMEAELETASKLTLEASMNQQNESNQVNTVDELSSNYQAPVTDVEKKLCKMWSELFGVDKVGVKDDFFELGGDSLKSMTLIRRIHKEFNTELALEDFFRLNQVEQIAKEVQVAIELSEIKDSNNKIVKGNQIRI